MTGYQSKKAATQDKLNDDDLTIAYQSGYYDGKKAAQPAQEPVAMLFGSLPVYDTAPPQRTWVGLTKEDMPDGENPMFDHEYFIAGMVFAANILKEKNT